jgi:hypothetical protein
MRGGNVLLENVRLLFVVMSHSIKVNWFLCA